MFELSEQVLEHTEQLIEENLARFHERFINGKLTEENIFFLESNCRIARVLINHTRGLSIKQVLSFLPEIDQCVEVIPFLLDGKEYALFREKMQPQKAIVLADDDSTGLYLTYKKFRVYQLWAACGCCPCSANMTKDDHGRKQWKTAELNFQTAFNNICEEKKITETYWCESDLVTKRYPQLFSAVYSVHNFKVGCDKIVRNGIRYSPYMFF